MSHECLRSIIHKQLPISESVTDFGLVLTNDNPQIRCHI